jgi:hypothetical protein
LNPPLAQPVVQSQTHPPSQESPVALAAALPLDAVW